MFTRQLATLLQAGLPLLKAFSILRNQERNLRFKQVLSDICDQIESRAIRFPTRWRSTRKFSTAFT